MNMLVGHTCRAMAPELLGKSGFVLLKVRESELGANVYMEFDEDIGGV